MSNWMIALMWIGGSTVTYSFVFVVFYVTGWIIRVNDLHGRVNDLQKQISALEFKIDQTVPGWDSACYRRLCNLEAVVSERAKKGNK